MPEFLRADVLHTNRWGRALGLRWLRFGRLVHPRNNRGRLLVLVSVAFLLILGIALASGLYPQSAIQPTGGQRNLPPSWQFPLGTDTLGRDLLSRVLFGARVSLLVGVLANGAAVLIGLLVGVAAGYFRGAVEAVLMRLTDVMTAFPALILAIALAAILRPSLWIVALVIALVNWVWIARAIYAQVLSIRQREFVEAAGALGVGTFRTLFRHILPHLVSTLMVFGTLGISTTVLLEASLSFLGVGVQPPAPSWGGIINESQSYFLDAPWLVIFPGIAIVLTSLSFNLLGEALRDALDLAERR